MRIIYEEDLTKTQRNKAKAMAEFLEKKLHLGISIATNYEHKVQVVFDYLKVEFRAYKLEEVQYEH